MQFIDILNVRDPKFGEGSVLQSKKGGVFLVYKVNTVLVTSMSGRQAAHTYTLVVQKSPKLRPGQVLFATETDVDSVMTVAPAWREGRVEPDSFANIEERVTPVPR